MSIYASKEETDLAVRPATPDEQWLKDQVARISPDYDSQDAYMGYVNALEDLALELRDEKASTQRMFTAACVDLGTVAESLGLDPNAGGAAPILAAIDALRKDADTKQADEITRLQGEAGVLKALLALSRRSLVEIDADDRCEQEMLDALVDKIDAALSPVPVVQFLAADDTEGGAL